MRVFSTAGFQLDEPRSILRFTRGPTAPRKLQKPTEDGRHGIDVSDDESEVDKVIDASEKEFGNWFDGME